MTCNKQLDVQYIGDLPVDMLASLPDYILTERDVLDESTGNMKCSITRTPTAKLFPNANTDNVFGVEANNSAIAVPDGQVRAVYVQNQGVVNAMEYADTTHPATMIAVGTTNDVVLCQCCGAINIPSGHNYVIGMQYYTGANGEPVTSGTQKLFIPISNQKLVINM